MSTTQTKGFGLRRAMTVCGECLIINESDELVNINSICRCLWSLLLVPFRHSVGLPSHLDKTAQLDKTGVPFTTCCQTYRIVLYFHSVALGNMVFVSAEGQMNGCLVVMGAIGHYHKAYRYMEHRTPPLHPPAPTLFSQGPMALCWHTSMTLK